VRDRLARCGKMVSSVWMLLAYLVVGKVLRADYKDCKTTCNIDKAPQTRGVIAGWRGWYDGASGASCDCLPLSRPL
jgi:hypothetical protein